MMGGVRVGFNYRTGPCKMFHGVYGRERLSLLGNKYYMFNCFVHRVVSLKGV